MPVVGRKAKPAGQALNRNKPTFEWTEVADVPFADAPPLPPFPLPGEDSDEDWHAMTLDWWTDISTMPHVRLWKVSDWRFAVDTALVADRFYKGIMSAATELRNREKVLGTTADYRRDLRIRYTEPVESRPDTEDAPDNVSYLDL